LIEGLLVGENIFSGGFGFQIGKLVNFPLFFNFLFAVGQSSG
jgi:hypothetical protein